MFRRSPYWGWLALALLFWICCGYYFHQHRTRMLPERMAKAVVNDLRNNERNLLNLIAEQGTVAGMYHGNLREKDVERLGALPWYIFAYYDDSLTWWNTNLASAPSADTIPEKWTLRQSDKGVYIERSLRPVRGDSLHKLVAQLPVFINYPVENDYLQSHFAASDDIPVKTKIFPADPHLPGSFAVTMADGSTVFYLHLDPRDVEKWEPNGWFVCLLLAALITTIFWVHLTIIHLTRNRSGLLGLAITLGLVVTLRVLLYWFGLPFDLGTLRFFDPGLYASSKYLSSFGDLCISTLFVLWLVVFIVRHTPYKTYFNGLKTHWLRVLLAVGFSYGLVVYAFVFVTVIRSLVIDSSISFDVNHFYSTDIYTIYGLLIIGIISGISCLIIYLLNIQLTSLLQNRWLKYFLITLLSLLYIVFAGKAHNIFSWYLAAWLLFFCIVLDTRNFTLVSDLFEPHMIFWAVFICVSGTVTLLYFNQVKEQKARLTFVELKLAPRDAIMEYAFDKAATRMSEDSMLKDFLLHPSLVGRKMVNQRFDTMYLRSQSARYLPTISLFDSYGIGLYNKDTVSLDKWTTVRSGSIPTSSPYLYYRESILNTDRYLVYVPVYSDTINEKIGYIVIDLGQKKPAKETVYPELLQASTKPTNEREYAYAVYINGNLINQVNDYPFPTRLSNEHLASEQYSFIDKLSSSELHYKSSDKRTIVVAYRRNKAIEAVSLFSYVFVALLTLAVIIIIYQFLLLRFAGNTTRKIFANLSLRRRVQFAMLATVVTSFIIIGIVTMVFFTNQYQNSNQEKLQTAMQAARQSVQEYLKDHGAFDAEYVFDSVTASRNFELFISNLANNQKVDINIFSRRGTLITTSQDEIYDKGLIAGIMRPDAYYQLNNAAQSKVSQTEEVGELAYLSAYEPMRDENGATLGYINVPFFSSQKDLKYQISSILVSLINLYAFIFLLSGVGTVLITQWLTRSFNVVIRQFGRLNLQRNERISWPHDDEIGMLVREYNKMVNKVEENAALLAERERETAWREMARQVAHEIKNPLTPMKLHIQYLQNAMRNDSPNIKELTARVSASIIEQIDNLSYIASEFSNFAKMPEARPEELDLRQLLDTAAELHSNDEGCRVTINRGDMPLTIVADKSQLLRVFNNLLENARHATLQTPDGHIQVILKQESDYALITVKDNGEGINEEVAKRIFQPYFTTKSSGTGLGLAMTKKIIEFWKGEIWFESTEGIGTTFFIRLPLHRVSALDS